MPRDFYNGKVTLSIYVDRSLWDHFKSLSEAEGKSINKIIIERLETAKQIDEDILYDEIKEDKAALEWSKRYD